MKATHNRISLRIDIHQSPQSMNENICTIAIPTIRIVMHTVNCFVVVSLKPMKAFAIVVNKPAQSNVRTNALFIQISNMVC